MDGVGEPQREWRIRMRTTLLTGKGEGRTLLHTDGEDATFATREEAVARIAELLAAPYDLRDGEAGYPTYWPCRLAPL